MANDKVTRYVTRPFLLDGKRREVDEEVCVSKALAIELETANKVSSVAPAKAGGKKKPAAPAPAPTKPEGGEAGTGGEGGEGEKGGDA